MKLGTVRIWRTRSRGSQPPQHDGSVGGQHGTDGRALRANAADYKVNRLLFARIWRLTKPFWAQREQWRWWLLFLVLLALAPCFAALGYKIAQLTADMTNAIIAKEKARYEHLFWVTTAYGVVSWAVLQGMSYLSSRLELHWRQWLTDYMVTRYLHRKTYYDIALREDLDNPDQRIQQDIGPFVQVMAAIPRQVLAQALGLITGGAIVASVSATMTWFVVFYAALSTVVTLLIYTPTIRMNFARTVAEADLRYGILHVRDNAETVAFYRGESSEHAQIHRRLATAIKAQLTLIVYQLKTAGISELLSLTWQLAPFFLIAPLFFAGKIEYGTIAMATMAAAQMVQALSTLTTFIPVITSMAPLAVRLAQILERFDAMDAERIREQSSQIAIQHGTALAASHVSLETPGGEQKLVCDLDFQLRPGEHMIIVGQTGVGKSSLLRAMAGLWRRGSGTLVLPPLEECLFLPQRPYMILGDLRSQLLYPRGRRDIGDAELQRTLERVCLPDLLEKHGGPDAVRDWAKVLSLGEQQRIGFARVLISQAKFVFLDEATSAVDLETEARLHHLLKEVGASCISVAHRESLLLFHDKALCLHPGGTWQIRPTRELLNSLQAGANRPGGEVGSGVSILAPASAC